MIRDTRYKEFEEYHTLETKKPAREEIIRKTREYLDSGGEIQYIDIEVRKDNFDFSKMHIKPSNGQEPTFTGNAHNTKMKKRADERREFCKRRLKEMREENPGTTCKEAAEALKVEMIENGLGGVSIGGILTRYLNGMG